MKDEYASWLGRALVLLAAVTVVCATSLTGRAADAIPDETCLLCHGEATLTKTAANGQVLKLYVDQAKHQASVHRAIGCAGCHADLTSDHPDPQKIAKPVDCRRCHAEQATTYSASVHGLAAARGDSKTKVPGCTDCHGHHDILSRNSPAGPVYFANLTKTCGTCHDKPAAEVAASVHGQATAAGQHEAPTCIDCHGEHRILSLAGLSPIKMAEITCSKCHASAAMNAKFHLPADRVSTFLGSYHGLAAQGRSTNAANCASCHGHHLILPSQDPRSSVSPAHLAETCGKCHPGATAKFALSAVHSDGATGEDMATKINRYVRLVYLGLIFVTVGTLALHNLLAWLRTALAARRARGPTVLRMNRTQRIQHFILLFSFILLALTGFALKYPDTWLAFLFGNNEDVRRWLHRGAGVMLMGLGVYHSLYVIFTHDGRRLLRDFWPRFQDLKDLLINFCYLTGHRSERAKFGRFGYPEKMEYWAVAWGTFLMGATGLMVWYKLIVTGWLPRWVIDVALTIHYYEAILACLAIAVWHFYHVIFAPDVYPMNWAWWDGKVTSRWHAHEHPLEILPDAPAVPHLGEAQHPPANPPPAPQAAPTPPGDEPKK